MIAEEFYKEYFGYNPTEDQVLEIEFAEAYAKQKNEAIKRVSKKEILSLQREKQALQKQMDELNKYGIFDHLPTCYTEDSFTYKEDECNCGFVKFKQALKG